MSTQTTETPGAAPWAGRSGDPMLQIDDLSVYYGKIAAVRNVTLDVRKGEIVTIIGSNGAGKSTTLRTISGLLRPKTGKISFNGEQIHNRSGDEIVKRGICHSPEGRRIFPRMTVDENLDLGAFLRNDKAEVAATRAHVLELFPRLQERIDQKAGTMSGGEQQMLAVARAMMSRPRLLLLDEPSLGLAPLIIEDLFRRFGEINKETGTTMLVVEQNANLALEIASRGYVLEAGQIVLSGTADDLRTNEAVREAYLGA